MEGPALIAVAVDTGAGLLEEAGAGAARLVVGPLLDTLLDDTGRDPGPRLIAVTPLPTARPTPHAAPGVAVPPRAGTTLQRTAAACPLTTCMAEERKSLAPPAPLEELPDLLPAATILIRSGCVRCSLRSVVFVDNEHS